MEQARYYAFMAKEELGTVLDYILNKADEAEFEVIVKACERRRQDIGRYAKLGGLSPGALAGQMADTVQQGLSVSMDVIRQTVRGFVVDLIRQEAPEASEEDIARLLEHYLPERGAEPALPGSPGLVDVDAARLPPEALAVMAEEFLSYSLGAMPPSQQKELWDSLADWQDKYWESFPPALKALIKARVEGRLDDDQFWKAALTTLGL
jgi:hypothetical protein